MDTTALGATERPAPARTWQSESRLEGLALGEGDPASPGTLLLHGFAGSAEDWVPCWRGPGTALALRLPGHGPSYDPRGDWHSAIAQILSDLPTSVDRVVGYSLGGRIALGMLQSAPDRFRSAVILSAHPGLPTEIEREVRGASDRCWIELLRRDGVEAFVCTWEGLPLFATQARLSPSALARQRRRRLAQRAEGLIASLEVFGLGSMPDTRAAIADYPGELTWIGGAADRKFAEIAQRIAEMRPSTRLILLPGIGHNPLLECPERLADLLARD